VIVKEVYLKIKLTRFQPPDYEKVIFIMPLISVYVCMDECSPL
jgi:hypothetical protein